jgi:hypothetical protein
VIQRMVESEVAKAIPQAAGTQQGQEPESSTEH